MQLLPILLQSGLACVEPLPQDTGPYVVPTDTHDSGPVDPGPQSVSVVGELDGEYAVMLVSFQVGLSGVEDLETVSTAALVDGAASFTLDDPDASALWPLDSADGPQGRYGMLLVFEDLDGDASLDSDERFLGSADFSLLYIDQPTSVMEFLGFRGGWNAFRSLPTTTQVTDLDNLPLSLSLEPVDTLALSGSYSEDYGPGRVAMLPASWFSAPSVLDPLADQDIVASAWSITLDGAPPADHRLPATDALLPGGAIELAFFYLDNNGNGRFSIGQDTPALPACYEGQMALSVWIPPATSALAAVSYLGVGAQPGWSLATQSETGLDFLPAEAYSALSLSPSCPF